MRRVGKTWKNNFSGVVSDTGIPVFLSLYHHNPEGDKLRVNVMWAILSASTVGNLFWESQVQLQVEMLFYSLNVFHTEINYTTIQ